MDLKDRIEARAELNRARGNKHAAEVLERLADEAWSMRMVGE